MVPLLIFAPTGGCVVLALIYLLFLHHPQIIAGIILLFLCVLIGSQSIIHAMAVAFVCMVATVSLFTYSYYLTKRESEEWEANQKPRCEGYHPDNGWEYLENSDSNPLN